MSQIQSFRKQVLQLRQEANINRIPVSQACDENLTVKLALLLFEVLNSDLEAICIELLDVAVISDEDPAEKKLPTTLPHDYKVLMKFCMEHQKSDVLVIGISQSENPFKENKGCTIL